MKTAFIYSGQGAQVVGMGADFYENEPAVKSFYDEMNELTDIKKYSFGSTLEEISKTAITQMVLVTYHIAVTKLLQNAGISPQATIGLSIGEYSSLYAAGVLDAKDSVKIAIRRGELMGNICGDTAMYAVLKSDESEIADVLARVNAGKSPSEMVYIANYNCPGQIVISGDRAACEEAAGIFEEIGRRTSRLNVSGAFHTPFMHPAGEQLGEFLRGIEFKQKKIPVYTNLTGRDEEITEEMMVAQLQSPVRFEQAALSMLGDGVDIIVEIGYNNTIKNLMKRIDKSAQVLSISNYESYAAALEILRA